MESNFNKWEILRTYLMLLLFDYNHIDGIKYKLIQDILNKMKQIDEQSGV